MNRAPSEGTRDAGQSVAERHVDNGRRRAELYARDACDEGTPRAGDLELAKTPSQTASVRTSQRAKRQSPGEGNRRDVRIRARYARRAAVSGGGFP